MNHILNAVLNAVNPSRQSEALYQEVLSNLKRAGAPRVDALFAEFEAKIEIANKRMGL
jgi:hypothetical protein